MDKPPRVLFQQNMNCKSCLYETVVHELVPLDKISDGWDVSKRKLFSPHNICSLCYRSLEPVGESVVLWCHLFNVVSRQKREAALRGDATIKWENEYWICWSDSLKMAQHSMILGEHSSEWSRHYYAIKDNKIIQPAVLV